MADLKLRTIERRELTFAEIDRNFTSLDSDIQGIAEGHWDSADTISLIDSAYVQLRAQGSHWDSSDTTLLIDSDYIQSRQAFSAFDSDEVTAIIDSDYIVAKIDGIDAGDGGNDF